MWSQAQYFEPNDTIFKIIDTSIVMAKLCMLKFLSEILRELVLGMDLCILSRSAIPLPPPIHGQIWPFLSRFTTLMSTCHLDDLELTVRGATLAAQKKKHETAS